MVYPEFKKTKRQIDFSLNWHIVVKLFYANRFTIHMKIEYIVDNLIKTRLLTLDPYSLCEIRSKVSVKGVLGDVLSIQK